LTIKISVSVLAAAFAAALSSTAFAADKSLIKCNTGVDSFNVELVRPGVLRVNGREVELLSVLQMNENGTGGGPEHYNILTTKNHYIRVYVGKNASSVKDVSPDDGSNYIGGFCDTSSTQIDIVALNALVARTKELRSASWDLATCMFKNAGEVLVQYHTGFIPGTIIATSTEGPNHRMLSYIFSSVEKQGAMGTSYTTLEGTGMVSYWDHVYKPMSLGNLTIAHNKITDIHRIQTGQSFIDDAVEQCTINNQWHIEKLLTKN